MFSTNAFQESPNNALLGIAQKFILSRVLMIFAEFKLGRILENGPIELMDLAVKLNAHPKALKRFLRLLTAHHIIQDLGGDCYGPTTMSHYFDKILDAKLADDYNGLDKALDAIKTNRSLTDVFDKSLYEYLNKYLSQSASHSGHDLIQIAHEFILAKTVMSSAELRLDTILRDKAISLDDISSSTGIPSNVLKLFLQVLTRHGIVDEVKPESYQSTSLTAFFDRILSPHILDGYKVFNGAQHTLRTNTGAWEHVFGKSFYDYLNQDSAKLQMFKQWCVQSAIDWLPPILSLCNFPLAKTLVDVGGGGGHFLASVLQKNPHMDGVLFDQPSIIAGADKSEIFKSLRNRTRFVGGDFFKAIPQGGDIYTICRTLLNWSDEKSIEIINRCHDAMSPNSKLWIIDFMVPNADHPKYPRAVINDISLFVIFNSAIRTEQEWRTLISKTLFSVSHIFITQEDIKPEPFYPMCIIEALPKNTNKTPSEHNAPRCKL